MDSVTFLKVLHYVEHVTTQETVYETCSATQ
jgi:hypothetical protein